MAKEDILSTSQFLATMRKKPLGSDSDLTMEDATILNNMGVDVSSDVSDVQQVEQESKNWWDQVTGWFSDIGQTFLNGFVGMFEGIVDVGAGIVSNIVGWAGGDNSGINEFIATDYTDRFTKNLMASFSTINPVDWIVQAAQGKTPGIFTADYWSSYGNSLIKAFVPGAVNQSEVDDFYNEFVMGNRWDNDDWGWFGDFSVNVAGAAGQVVSQMIPYNIGQSLGLSTKATKALTLGTLGVGATGTGMEQGLKEGGDIHTSSLYGLLSGVTEVGTEMLGGLGGNWADGVLGKWAVKSPVVKKFTSSIAGNFAMGFVSEGLEEVISDTLDPVWRKVSYDPSLDLGAEYTSKEFWAGLGSSFLVGGLVGGISSGVRTYKLGKTTINGKKIGSASAIAYQEYSDIKNDFHNATEKAFSEFKNLVDTNDIDITDSTQLDTAIDQVMNSDQISQEQKDSFKKKIDKAQVLADKYVVAENKLIGELEAKGITTEDLQAEYKLEKSKNIEKVSKEFNIDTVQEQLDSTSSIIENNKLLIDNNTDTNTDLTIETSSMVLDNTDNLVEKAQNLASDMQKAKWQNIAIKRNIKADVMPMFIQQNVAVEVLKNVANESDVDLKNANDRDIIISAIANSDSVEEASLYVRQYVETKLPDTSTRHDLGNNTVSVVSKPPRSAISESLGNKFLDDAFAVRRYFKRAGFNETQTNDIIRKVRASSGIARETTETGFAQVVKSEDGKLTIKYDSKGIYNGKDGIFDNIVNYAKSSNLNVADVNALVQEGLSLLDEIDRQKEGKTVFGTFYSQETLTDAEMNVLKRENIDLYNRIIDGESISEAEFEDLVGKGFTSAYLTEEQINTRLAQIRGQVTNFDEICNELYKYNDLVLQKRVEAQMITQEQADEWRKTKPHYVPEFRVLIGDTAKGDSGVKLQSTDLRGAKGSNLVIQDIFLSVEKQTKKVFKFQALNELLLQMGDTKADGVELVERKPYVTDINQDVEVDYVQMSGENVYAYRNGEQLTFKVSPELAESLHSLNNDLKQLGENSRLLRTIQNMAGTVRNLMTSWNPFFSWFRNPIKDIQSAIIYTKNGTGTFLKNWGRALTQVVSKTDLYKIYEMKSGQSMTLKDSYGGRGENSFYKYVAEGKLSKTLRYLTTHFENANEIMEQTTRFAEFLSSYERLTKQGISDSKAIDVALVDANEITLNFSRKGIYTKVLNRYVPFLTANIEGAARNVRAFISPKSAKEWASLIIKMLILGLAPQVIQELIYADDEDYQNLSDSMKSNYYLIKAGDNFIRVPKGFIQQAFSSDVVFATKFIRGEDVGSKDVKQLLESNWNAIGVDVSGVFFQPIIDASNNKTWYGSNIVGAQWDSTRPSEQYTKSTSEISKFLGRIFNISPLKVDYVLDQMTGIIGDIVLPLTSQESENPFNIFKKQIMTDYAYSNKLSSDFYDYKQEKTYDKTDGDVVSSIVLTYLNKCSNQISDLKELQKQVQEDTTLSQEEKNSQDRLYQVMKNVAYSEALNNAKKLEKELANYELSETSKEQDVREATRQALGAEESLRMCCSASVYNRAKSYKKLGVSYDQFYVYYFNMKALPDKKSVEKYIGGLRTSAYIKNLLYRLMGYKLDEQKIILLTRWLKQKGLTTEEIESIL